MGPFLFTSMEGQVDIFHTDLRAGICKKYLVQKDSESKKNVWPKNIWIKKNVGSKIILDPKENLVKQNSGLTKFLFQKKFRSKKILRPKNLLAKQKFLMVKRLG